MDELKFGFISIIVIVAIAVFGGYVASDNYKVNAKKDDCENALILRADECTAYYLTTEEVKLIDRLGE
jgi:hypothetical protein